MPEGLVPYLREHGMMSPKHLDCLRSSLESRLYAYGDQFRSNFERSPSLRQQLRTWLRDRAYQLAAHKSRWSRSKAGRGRPAIISSAYFNFNDELRQATGWEVLDPPWGQQFLKSASRLPAPVSTKALKLGGAFNRRSFNALLREEFCHEIDDFKASLADFCIGDDIRALVVPNDESFFESAAIEVFQALHKPSYIFLHGLPGRYSPEKESRADFLLVWGRAIRDQYLRTGFDPARVLVTGHPRYQSYSFDPQSPTEAGAPDPLTAPLVLSRQRAAGSCQWGGRIRLVDRADALLYLASVQQVLQRLGVKRARLRLHPAESPAWYEGHIDRSFFVLDRLPLAESLHLASAVIGPFSTVLLETLYADRGFYLYDPNFLPRDEGDFALVPPGDGRDVRVPLARSEVELLNHLKDRR